MVPQYIPGLCQIRHLCPSQLSPKVHKIADIPPANFLNGMTALPGNPNTVLLADSLSSRQRCSGAEQVAISHS